MKQPSKLILRSEKPHSPALLSGGRDISASRKAVRKKRVNNKRYRPERGADAILVLEDGTVFWGKGAGASGVAVGELCFNTSMSGYQEILSDPSYAGQIINFTFPHIGNVGSNENDSETVRPFARGLVLGCEITQASNYRAEQDFVSWLKHHKLIAITGLDCRALTHYIRKNGAPRAVIAYKPMTRPYKQSKMTAKRAHLARFNIPALLGKVQKWQGLKGMDLAKKVTIDKPYQWHQGLYHFADNNQISARQKNPDNIIDSDGHIVAIDYGIKHNILRHLASLGMKITVVPANFSAKKILSLAPDGIFLSNGPGDPAATSSYSTPIIQALLAADLPIFGICIGHQLLAIALGAKTEKMVCGHRGANHPVKNLLTGAVEITSQNHGFKVLAETLPNNLKPTHISLFDNSLEGIAMADKPVFAVQYHPEASPGPHDSHYLFRQFQNLIADSLRKKSA